MDLKIEYVPLDSLKEYKGNAKEHPPKQVAEIRESIQEFGMIDPIGIWGDNVIVEGHGRAMACRELGLESVPVIRLDQLTDEQRRAYSLVHNKTTMDSGFDFETLEGELEGIEGIDMSLYGFDTSDWFEDRQRWEKKQEGNDEYNAFLDKFEVKKTTDDCYTPDAIYDVIADWVADTYKVSRSNFVRPFYPGGDYQSEKYLATDIVVDNPPFSILTAIINWYLDHGVKFFLFAPSLTGLSSRNALEYTTLACGGSVTYENGACVNTSFVTNLEADYIVRTAPDLAEAITSKDKELQRAVHAELPKYNYPPYILTMAKMCSWARYGVDFRVPRGHAVRISSLDAQKQEGNSSGIYGGGLLVSEKVKDRMLEAEAEAEAEKRNRDLFKEYELSEREKAIVYELSERGSSD